MEKHVPRTSRTVPSSFLAIELGRRIRAIPMTASSVMFPSCVTFLTFFLSLGGSLSSLSTIAAALGMMVGVATRLTTLSLTATLMDFQSMVAFWISSPTFFGERPRGPSFGARAEAEPISPPTAFKITVFSSPDGGGGPMVLGSYVRMNLALLLSEGWEATNERVGPGPSCLRRLGKRHLPPSAIFFFNRKVKSRGEEDLSFEIFSSTLWFHVY